MSKTRQVMKKATKQRGIQDIADEIGFHSGTIYNQQNGVKPYEPCGKTPNIVDSFINLNRACQNNILLEYVAEVFQFILIKNPTVDTADTPAIAHISKILKEFASLIDEIATANDDNIITMAESENIRLKWEVMKRILEEFVVSCEKGAFSHAK
ncbi:MAG: hypothetical protein NE328_13760 [Lentisphaeraceae bacterium]|nr:hypothetical protein [Lentisphaeraceae bacterium]